MTEEATHFCGDRDRDLSEELLDAELLESDPDEDDDLEEDDCDPERDLELLPDEEDPPFAIFCTFLLQDALA